ncbi:hypothetical protein E1B28_003509 [Marasmius oreades]|uniref:Uncharacterized protein n=1 Tax=Marasmius oreades TaxID=181124 RepID=A0A9P7RMN7_9AGAR|nr:uncharacterized protein E1B28_003509 [Marasmius oreades]KAG7085986.1 hypothetical protein E1B28_003509 [Marasmius oreades]
MSPVSPTATNKVKVTPDSSTYSLAFGYLVVLSRPASHSSSTSGLSRAHISLSGPTSYNPRIRKYTSIDLTPLESAYARVQDYNSCRTRDAWRPELLQHNVPFTELRHVVWEATPLMGFPSSGTTHGLPKLT